MLKGSDTDFVMCYVKCRTAPSHRWRNALTPYCSLLKTTLCLCPYLYTLMYVLLFVTGDVFLHYLYILFIIFFVKHFMVFCFERCYVDKILLNIHWLNVKRIILCSTQWGKVQGKLLTVTMAAMATYVCRNVKFLKLSCLSKIYVWYVVFVKMFSMNGKMFSLKTMKAFETPEKPNETI